jgi:phosphoenolpyruvate carboxykinase (GTP)
VLKWVFERCAGKGQAAKTPIGYVPAPGALDLTGLDLPQQNMQELLRVEPKAWLAEIEAIRDHYAQFGERLPKALAGELAALEKRLSSVAGG